MPNIATALKAPSEITVVISDPGISVNLFEISPILTLLPTFLPDEPPGEKTIGPLPDD